LRIGIAFFGHVDPFKPQSRFQIRSWFQTLLPPRFPLR